MKCEMTDEYSNSNSCCDQLVCTSASIDPTLTTGTQSIETANSSFFNGTQVAYGTIVKKTTGTPFQAEIVYNSEIRYVFSYGSFKESLLSFLDIVNNKDGWSFLH
jgi:hypothetical protein